MRIALVEPSSTMRQIVTRLLEARDHEVVPFADEHEAVRQIAPDLRIEAIVASYELQRMSGLEFCWEARLLATPRRPIYVLMMSSEYDQRALVEVLDAGADDFIGKPPLAEELYARLRAAERLAGMQRELIRLATTDPLTGLSNRRGFFEQASEVRARTSPDGSLSAILLDIDNFKRINDAYGHDAGDEAIRICAEAARLEGAVSGRLGGDEFALLLEQHTLQEAMEVAEDLRLRLASRSFETANGPITLTFSIGVGEAQAKDTVDQLLARADAALLSAKAEGRDRVVAAPVDLKPKRTVTQQGIARAVCT